MKRIRTAGIIRTSCFVAFLITAICSALALAQESSLVIHGPVTDLTNTLSGPAVSALQEELRRFEDSTSNQVAVVIIPSLDGDEIRNVGIRLLEQNKIGQKGKDNGVLLLVAKDDRKVSIEVGYGLEGVLTDALCDQIIRYEILPRFKEGDYDGGVMVGTQAIMLATQGAYSAGSRGKQHPAGWFSAIVTFIIILSIAMLIGRRRSYAVSSLGASSVWWWGSGFGGRGGGGGWGSFGGGGGGGGGWSAGGGSFGGGGASGSW